MERFRIEVGYDHDVKPGNIVGAIANEAGVDGNHIGQIEISEEFTTLDLPKGMPKEIFKDLQKVWVCGRQLNISRIDGDGNPRKSDKRSFREERQEEKAAHTQRREGSGGKPGGESTGKSHGKGGSKSGPKTAGKASRKPGGKKKVRKKTAGKKPAGKRPDKK
jgi:ATP-dependent RNA helicase DeaD